MQVQQCKVVQQNSLGKEVQNTLTSSTLVYEITSQVCECLLCLCPRNSASDLSGNSAECFENVQIQVSVPIVSSLKCFSKDAMLICA